MNKKTIILIFVILALLVGAGVWKWKNEAKKKDITQDQTQQQIVENPPLPPKKSFDDLFSDIQSTDVVIPNTDSWHIYEDTNVGFTTKLPKAWIGQLSLGTQVCLGTVDDRYGIETEGIGFDCPIQISNFDKDRDLVIKNLEESIKKDTGKFSKIKINEKQVIYSIKIDGSRHFDFENEGRFWYIIVNNKKNSIDSLITIANGIISEFKSTK